MELQRDALRSGKPCAAGDWAAVLLQRLMHMAESGPVEAAEMAALMQVQVATRVATVEGPQQRWRT